MNELFERIDIERRKNKLSVERFGMLIGYQSRSFYYDSWAKNPDNIGAGNLKKVAELFNVSSDYLLGISENPNIQ